MRCGPATASSRNACARVDPQVAQDLVQVVPVVLETLQGLSDVSDGLSRRVVRSPL